MGDERARALALRDDFDGAFARPPASADEEAHNVLAIRVGGEPYALMLGQTHGLFADRKIVPLPGRSAAFLGISCLRTGIIAVYSLRAVLGYGRADAPMRWLVCAGEGRTVALAFEQFDAYARVAQAELCAAPGDSRHIAATAMIAGMRRSVISLDSIMQTITATS